MADITCTAVNDQFTSESGRFAIDIVDRNLQTSPWQRLTPFGAFPQGLGSTINDLTIESVLTESDETDWADVSQNNGTGIINEGCVPDPTLLSFGNTVRQFSLQTKSYLTPCICLDDLKTVFAVNDQVSKTVDALTKAQRWILDNRLRAGYIDVAGSVNQVISLRANLPVSNGVNGALPPPTNVMTAQQLDDFRLVTLRDGGFHNALGMENGLPVLGWITSPEASRDILRNNSELRQDVRFAQPSQLVAPLGVERSYGGYFHIMDMFLPRYEYNQGEVNPWERVMPLTPTATTQGFKWDANPAYQAAPYELQFIYHRDAWEVMVQKQGPDIPNAPFTDRPEYYTMEFFWLNIPNMTNNPLGKIGRWLAIGTNAIRSKIPQLARAVMVKRCVATPAAICTYS